MELSKRQKRIVEIVKKDGPISGDDIAERLHLSRAALRADLAVLTMAGFLDARPRVGYFYSGKTMKSFLAESIRKIRVADVISVPVVVSTSTSVYDSVVTLFVEDVGSLMVVDEDGHLAGIVSRKDLLKNALGGMNLERVPVEVVMTRMPNVVVTVPDETVWEVAHKLTEYEVDSLPVVRLVENEAIESGKKNYQVVGRISKTTIARLFYELGKEQVVK